MFLINQNVCNQYYVCSSCFSQPISGPIKDLAWSPDNQRMVCVGEGREKFGHVFLADTGTSNGDITGQSRPINSCDFRYSVNILMHHYCCLVMSLSKHQNHPVMYRVTHLLAEKDMLTSVPSQDNLGMGRN